MDTNEINIFVVLGPSLDIAKYFSHYYSDGQEYISSEKLETSNELNFKELHLPLSTKVREVIKIFGLKEFFIKNSIDWVKTYAYNIKRVQLNSDVYSNSKNKKEAEKHYNNTLADLGINNNEVIILDAVEIDRYFTGNIVQYCIREFSTTVDFLDLVKNTLPEQSSHLNMVLLYTDADVKLARFIREFYADLHTLSKSKLHVYVLESLVIENQFSEYIKYWHSKLSDKLYVIWTLLGWLRTKPYDKTQCYKIGEIFGISPKHLPCAVLFNLPSPEKSLIFPISQPYVDFFRTLFAEINKIIEPDRHQLNLEKLSYILEYLDIDESELISSLKEKSSRLSLFSILTRLRLDIDKSALFSLMAHLHLDIDELDLFYLGINEEESKQKLYEMVEQEYTKIKDAIMRNPKANSTNEYIFYGKTVFINQPTENVSLSKFQND